MTVRTFAEEPEQWEPLIMGSELVHLRTGKLFEVAAIRSLGQAQGDNPWDRVITLVSLNPDNLPRYVLTENQIPAIFALAPKFGETVNVTPA